MNRRYITRRELCERLGLSRSTLTRRLKQFGVNPVKTDLYLRKTIYEVTEIERVFNVKLRDDDQGTFLENSVKSILEEES